MPDLLSIVGIEEQLLVICAHDIFIVSHIKLLKLLGDLLIAHTFPTLRDLLDGILEV